MDNEVKVIFLDAGGVLFDTFVKSNERISYLLTERGFSQSKIDVAVAKANQYKQAFFDNENWISNWREEEQFWRSYYGMVAQELGDDELTNELLFFAHFAAHCKLFPEVKEVLEGLHARYRLAVISNAFPSMDWIFDRLGIRKYFEAIILSAFVNVSKPNEAIYNIAVEQLQIHKNEAVFIDDRMENVEGAEQVGMRALHLDREKFNLLELLKEQKIW